MKYLFIAMLSFAAVPGFAKNSTPKDVPAAVIAAFQNGFPGADDVKWEKEGANFEVDFELKDSDMSAIYDPSGVLLEKETEVGVAELPAGTKEMLEKRYPGIRIADVAKVEKGGVIQYEIDLKKVEVIVDAAGNFVEEETEGEDDGEKDQGKRGHDDED